MDNNCKNKQENNYKVVYDKYLKDNKINENKEQKKKNIEDYFIKKNQK